MPSTWSGITNLHASENQQENTDRHGIGHISENVSPAQKENDGMKELWLGHNSTWQRFYGRRPRTLKKYKIWKIHLERFCRIFSCLTVPNISRECRMSWPFSTGLNLISMVDGLDGHFFAMCNKPRGLSKVPIPSYMPYSML